MQFFKNYPESSGYPPPTHHVEHQKSDTGTWSEGNLERFFCTRNFEIRKNSLFWKRAYETPNLTPRSLNPRRLTLSPKPETLNPRSWTLGPKL